MTTFLSIYNYYRILIYLFGISLSSLGLALSIISQLGVSSWDAVFTALGTLTPLSIGTWSVIIQASFLACTAFLDGKANIYCLLPIILRGLTLDIAMKLLHIYLPANLPNPYILFTSGYILVVIGIGIYVATDFPRLPIDGFMLAISKFYKISISKARFIIEISGLITALVLNGPIGPGTIIVTFTIGKCIGTAHKLFCKLFFKKETFHYANNHL